MKTRWPHSSHPFRQATFQGPTRLLHLLTHPLLLSVTCCALLFVQVPALEEGPREGCSKCFTTSPEHAYCLQEGFGDNGLLRCDSRANLLRSGCNESNIVRPEAELYVVQDQPLSRRMSADEDVIQLRPQRIKLRLPPGVKRRIQLQYREVLDYPLDLYYLMDLSKSMADDKEKLNQLGDELSSRMRNITANFKLGFGSFVDKVTMPFVNTVPAKLISPCHECVAPYGFRNHMKLSEETTTFSDEVHRSQISGNLDAPEGGLDAIMQSIVCNGEINWSKVSRKMLLFTTDASFHSAGDAKLAGIVSPNDGECHLDTAGMYTESLEQDYPSLSQINHKAREKHVNIIFAVTGNQLPIYNKVVPLIEGSSVGELFNDSSNIVNLIEEQYKSITSEIELKDNATSNILMKYYSKCFGETMTETSKCEGLKVGTTVDFEVEVQVESCPKQSSDLNQTIRVYPVGLSESLLIDLEIVCNCDCEQPWNIEVNSKKCNEAGDFVCGLCVCKPDRYGPNCECDAKDHDPGQDLQECINGTDTRVCSGRGSCRCGKCVCNQRDNIFDSITGQFCQCDNLSCSYYNGKLCAGPDHGICRCGTCNCLDGWTGENCACSTRQDKCRDPISNKICGGHGVCECNECKCYQDNERYYTGNYCQDCPTCPTLCEQFKDCVRCKTFETGPLAFTKECDLCTNATFSITNVTEFDVLAGEFYCAFRDDDDCTYQFKYRIDPKDTGDYTEIVVDRDKDCPYFPFFLLLLALALLILLLGLLGLLLWKCLTMWKDSRECANFMKEKDDAAWNTNQNPIFQQATSTHKNPIYKGD